MLQHAATHKAWSKIGLGSFGIGGGMTRNTQTDDAHVQLIRTAVNLGLTVIDTAETYGEGHTEELIGQAVRGQRNRVTIVTKYAPEHSSSDEISRAAEGSLRRLSTDTIDLYLSHWPNPDIPIEDTLHGLEHLVEAGKVRSIGFSNTPPAQLRRLLEIGRRLPIACIQQDYSLTARYAEQAFLPICKQHDLSFMAYSPLGKGRKLNQTQNECLNELANKYNVSSTQIMLAWFLRFPRVIPIPMTTNLLHLEENAKAASLQLTDGDIQRLDNGFPARFKELPVEEIIVESSITGKVFTSLEEARNNSLNLTPSPQQLAAEILHDGDILKPVKVRQKPQEGTFHLFEGQLRYWAWRLAFEDTRPIPAQIET